MTAGGTVQLSEGNPAQSKGEIRIMNVTFADKGAERYVMGKIEPFDQKNEMFCRSVWDPKVTDIGEKFYMEETPPKNQPGHRLFEQSLVNGAWHLENYFA